MFFFLIGDCNFKGLTITTVGKFSIFIAGHSEGVEGFSVPENKIQQAWRKLY